MSSGFWVLGIGYWVQGSGLVSGLKTQNSKPGTDSRQLKADGYHFSSLFQYARSRKFRHAGWNLLAPKWPTGCQRGFFGCWISLIPASWGVRFPLRTLHARHAQTTFSHVDAPPRERGMTWSSESSAEENLWPQYWQR